MGKIFIDYIQINKTWLTLVISILSLMISFFNLFRSRRKIHISASFKNTTIYNKILESDPSLSLNFNKNVVGPVINGCEYYLIEIIVSNTSPHAITIKNIEITDSSNNFLPVVSLFQLSNNNRSPFLSNYLAVYKSYVTPESPFQVADFFSPYKDSPLILSPFESSLNTFAIYITKEDKDIPNYFHVKCTTTISRSKIASIYFRIRNYIVKKLNITKIKPINPSYKTFSIKSSKSGFDFN